MLNNSLNVKSIKQTENIVGEASLPQNKSESLLDTKNQLPKIVGDIRHYPPANKE
jgi:hypothetical protein